ncbi:hypothetical protein GGR54DRAFT_642509 [Hypoxylon sp. NC1633]|nr:hypothetical protein GGR54DRAFT_642509 [Hypoxylon sp. NC1633]
MGWPKGGPPSQKDLDKDICKASGSGTIDDPKIIWRCQTPDRKFFKAAPAKNLSNLTRSIEYMAVRHAIRLKCAYVWIIAAPHPCTMTTTLTNARGLTYDENHITVRLGPNERWYSFSSHIYVEESSEDGTLSLCKRAPNPQIWAWGDYISSSTSPGYEDTLSERQKLEVLPYALSFRDRNQTQKMRKKSRYALALDSHKASNGILGEEVRAEALVAT